MIVKHKICLDIRVSQKASKFTGVGIYAKYLAKKLLDSESDYEFYFLVLKGYELPFDIPIAKLITVTRFKKPESLQELFDFFDIKRKLKKLDILIFHSLVPSILIPSKNLSVVVTVHDIIPDVLPQENTGSFYAKWLYKFKMLRSKRATIIITDSNATRKDLQTHYLIEYNKISTVYLGSQYPLVSFNITSKNPVYRSSRPYLLYIGGFNYRKNVAKLICAFGNIINKFPDIDLVIAGKPPIGLDIRLKEISKDLKLNDRIIWLGFVDDDDLPSLYSNSTAFIYLSLYEGFGLPVLEAMQYGSPVITSNRSSIPEIVGEAALLVDPESIEEISTAIEKILLDKNVQNKMRYDGVIQARKFSWQICAEETLKVYKNVSEDLV